MFIETTRNYYVMSGARIPKLCERTEFIQMQFQFSIPIPATEQSMSAKIKMFAARNGNIHRTLLMNNERRTVRWERTIRGMSKTSLMVFYFSEFYEFTEHIDNSSNCAQSHSFICVERVIYMRIGIYKVAIMKCLQILRINCRANHHRRTQLH